MAIQGEAIVSLECVLPLNSDILKSHLQLISREGSDTKGGKGWSSEGIPPPPGAEITPFLTSYILPFSL